MNCTEPPAKPAAGTWEWDGELAYGSSVLYTCGPYGNFLSPEGDLFEELTAFCAWNQTWIPSSLPPCGATSCQEVPFPPKSTGLEFVPDAKNSLTPASKFSMYNPSLPLKMKFPGEDFCDGEGKMLVVGKIPVDAEDVPEIIFQGNGTDEAFHVQINHELEFVQRWGVVNNVSQGTTGEAGDGTTIDIDEPFILSIQCDPDGWVLKVNKEQNYPHSFHLFPAGEIKSVNVLGDVQLSYIGFGSKGSVRSWLICYPWLYLDLISDLEPAPPVSFNLTFMCPEGEVRS